MRTRTFNPPARSSPYPQRERTKSARFASVSDSNTPVPPVVAAAAALKPPRRKLKQPPTTTTTATTTTPHSHSTRRCSTESTQLT
ncbi:hypothetical protein RSOL_230050 [Rhizoctonia solani AG-3 Rhs1AP]|uniref:Uncharacterized protein n=1 Tax=Rhizoctonia solani AG-3 Rhs1AP TaxID=1086054 RepID=X8J6Z2_9AGAM|nr:hypothetical protein RSOL_230050 [Rhizoctonia solani AG-3 Rhs1AP]